MNMQVYKIIHFFSFLPNPYPVNYFLPAERTIEKKPRKQGCSRRQKKSAKIVSFRRAEENLLFGNSAACPIEPKTYKIAEQKKMEQQATAKKT